MTSNNGHVRLRRARHCVMKSTRKAIFVIAALAVLGVACGDDAPVPGTLTISLVTPNADDGAILLNLGGPGLTTPQSASSSYILFSRLESSVQLRIAIVGNLTAGPLFTLSVSDVRDLSAFSSSVIEVATRSDELRSSVTGYDLDIVSSAGPQSQLTGGLTDPVP